jgi:hypothetical protein
MPRVVVKGGLLIPMEPLPPDWEEGSEFDVSLTRLLSPPEQNGHPYAPSAENDWIDDEDYAKMVEALAEADQIEKERMRREMGL